MPLPSIPPPPVLPPRDRYTIALTGEQINALESAAWRAEGLSWLDAAMPHRLAVARGVLIAVRTAPHAPPIQTPRSAS